ncbi:hypothetical protein [Agrobacterium sp.]|jgi:hypothetical protein|uniref:hypothetical protein n=1 Tax=Agrobacterium sp. TaxID=361 RepID=UPI0028AC9FA1
MTTTTQTMMIAAITNLPARRFSGLLSFGSVLRKIGSSGAFGVMKYLSLNTPITNAANALEFQKGDGCRDFGSSTTSFIMVRDTHRKYRSHQRPWSRRVALFGSKGR